MTKRRRILIPLACGLLGAVLILFSRLREPAHAGHSLSYWVDELWQPRTSKQQVTAAEAIRHIGTKANPYLLAWLQEEEPSLRRQFWQAINNCLGLHTPDWISRKAKTERMQSERAMYAFILLGEDAKPAIPELVRIMNNPQTPHSGRSAATVLADLGIKEAFPAIFAVLNNKQHPARSDAIRGVHAFGTNARPAIPLLLQCLQETDMAVVANAAQALGQIKLEPALVVPALAKQLSNPEIEMRWCAADCLGRFGAEARPAAPALVVALSDPVQRVREAITNILLKIAPEALTNAPPK